jgi:hypothetical protein
VRRPADLGLYPLDELPDHRGCSYGLFLLDLPERGLLVLVGKIGAEPAADDQHAGDEADQQHDVLAKQLATRVLPFGLSRTLHGLGGSQAHSITSSARRRIEGGMVMPRVLAVLRLTTSSKLVGCSIGRSAGLAPLRILSTYAAARRNRSL